MLRIGLTGGIASGKTAVSDRLARLGASVIDTDLLSRELVEPGQPALHEIEQAFGPDVIGRDGHLDRRALRDKVFANPAERRRLEAILHPRIRALMLERAARSPGPYVVFVIPLLAETGQASLVDRVLLVDVPEAVQRQRLQARDGIDPAQVERMLGAQAERTQRHRLADDIIENSGTLSELDAAVQKLHLRYLDLAAG